MVQIERTARIAAPVHDVWTLLADLGGISAWAPNVDHSCLLTEQADGPGTVRRVQAGRTTLRETVTVWEPDATLAYTITGLPPVVRTVSTTWRLAAADGGATTDVTVTSEITPGPRPPHRVAARVVGRVLASAADRMLTGLDSHLAATRPARSEP